MSTKHIAIFRFFKECEKNAANPHSTGKNERAGIHSGASSRILSKNFVYFVLRVNGVKT